MRPPIWGSLKRTGVAIPQTIQLYNKCRKTAYIGGFPYKVGPSGETRTPGILLPKQARYQLRYTRLWNCFICGLSCGLGRFLTNGFAEMVPASGSVPAGCGVGPFPSWMGGICSQMCVATFSRHSSVLFGPFLCLGSSSLTLFCPACFKKHFRLLGFVWDWILCIKRCSVQFEGQWQSKLPQRSGAGIAPHKQRIKPFPPVA